MFSYQQEEATTMVHFSAESSVVPTSPTSAINFAESPNIRGRKQSNLNLHSKLQQDHSADVTHSTIDTFTPNSWKTG